MRPKHDKECFLKGIINRSVVICKTFTLSLGLDINILIVYYACMFLLTNALKGFKDSQRSKSKSTTKWIPVKRSHLLTGIHLNNTWYLKN